MLKERDSCDLLLAALGPNFIRAYPVFLSGAGYSRTVGQADSGTRPGKRTLKYCCFCWVHSGVRSMVCGQWFRCMLGYSCWIILGKDRGASRGMNNQLWRYGLIKDRCWGEQWRCRGEELRCVATRRVTLRTGVVSGSANVEKTGSFIVKTWNRWLVFQCSVNWARARLKTALIAVGAAASRGIYSAFSDRRLKLMRKELTNGQTGFCGKNQSDRGSISRFWGPDLIPDL